MSSGFVTENELAEARKKRQEEWEKVRQPDQPQEAPEETYDGRSLYDRLKEQKVKKDLEYEEQHKLKNLIRGLNDDDVEFLDLIDRNNMTAKKQRLLEEQKELIDFRERRATYSQQAEENKIQLATNNVKPKVVPAPSGNRSSQRKILSGAVVRKRKVSESNGTISTEVKKHAPEVETPEEERPQPNGGFAHLNKGAFKCIGILPGIGRYRESSDSEISTDSEEDIEVGKYDLAGRKTCNNKRKGKLTV